MLREYNDRLAPSFPQTIRMVVLKNLKERLLTWVTVWCRARPGLGEGRPGSNASLPQASCVNWGTGSNLLMTLLSHSNKPRTWAYSSCFPLIACLKWGAPGRGAEGGQELPSVTFQVLHGLLHCTLFASG